MHQIVPNQNSKSNPAGAGIQVHGSYRFCDMSNAVFLAWPRIKTTMPFCEHGHRRGTVVCKTLRSVCKLFSQIFWVHSNLFC